MRENRSAPLSSLGKVQGVASGGDALNTGLADENFYLPFFQYLPIPKNTAIASYLTFSLTLPVSQSERLWVEFPSGCVGLVGLQLFHGVEQIFPIPAGQWFKSNGFVFGFRFSHLWDKEPYTIEARVYNLDDTYQHTLWYAVELKGLPKGLTQNMKAFLKTIQG